MSTLWIICPTFSCLLAFPKYWIFTTEFKIIYFYFKIIYYLNNVKKYIPVLVKNEKNEIIHKNLFINIYLILIYMVHCIFNSVLIVMCKNEIHDKDEVENRLLNHACEMSFKILRFAFGQIADIIYCPSVIIADCVRCENPSHRMYSLIPLTVVCIASLVDSLQFFTEFM